MANERFDGRAPLVAQRDGVVVHEERDVFVDDLVVEFLRMLLHKVAREKRVVEGVAHTLGQQALELGYCCLAQLALCDDCTERKGQIGFVFPQLSQIGYEAEVATLIDEAPLVNEHSCIGLAALDGLGNLREEALLHLLDVGEVAVQQGVGRGVQTRRKDLANFTCFALATHQELAVATAECRAAVEQSVLVGDQRIYRIADFRDVGLATQYTLVEHLDVVVLHVELKVVSEAAVYQRIEGESVVRAGRDM